MVRNKIDIARLGNLPEFVVNIWTSLDHKVIS